MMASGEKKGLSPLAWVGIGCGILTILVVIVVVVGVVFVGSKVKEVAGDLDFEGQPELSAARMVVRLNPDWEEVAVDEDNGTITVRETSSGKEVTVSFEDIKDGKISFESEEGSLTIDGSSEEGTIKITGEDGAVTFGSTQGAENAPDWVPVYPGTEPSGGFFTKRDDGLSGAFEIKTSDSIDEVVEFFRSQLDDAGFNVRVNTFSGDGGTESAMVIGADEGGKRGVQVAIDGEGGETSVTVSYSQG
jgi:hypothetical protein